MRPDCKIYNVVGGSERERGMKGGKEKEKGVWVPLSNTTTMWGDRKEEYRDLVVVRSTTPKRFVGTMNS